MVLPHKQFKVFATGERGPPLMVPSLQLHPSVLGWVQQCHAHIPSARKNSELWVRGFPTGHHLTLPQRCVGIVWLCAKLTTVTWLTWCIVLALYLGLCRFCDLSIAWNYTGAGASQILKMKSILRMKLFRMTCLANCSWDAGKPRMVTEQKWK